MAQGSSGQTVVFGVDGSGAVWVPFTKRQMKDDEMYQEFSSIYEEKIRKDFDYKKMAGFIRQHCQAAGIKPNLVLDMGCGTGNASLELVQDVRQMVLCDPSSEMLTIARNKFKAPFLPQFIQGMADEIRIPDRFDLILSVLDVPNYLEQDELKAYLRNSYGNLKTLGLLIFDVSSVFKLEEMARVGTYIYDEDHYFHVWENKLKGQQLEMEINLFIKEPPPANTDLYQRITEQQTMFLHPRTDIEVWAREIGFGIIGVYDDYAEILAKPNTQRMVFVFKKEHK